MSKKGKAAPNGAPTTPSENTSSDGMLYGAIAVAVIGFIVAAAFYKYDTAFLTGISSSSSGPMPVSGAVPRVKWDSDDPFFAEKIAAKREPVILTNSPAVEWGASKWTPEVLSKATTTINGVKQDVKPVMRYFNAGVAGRRMVATVDEAIAAVGGKSERVDDISVAEFWRRATKTPPYVYFSGKVEELGGNFAQDVMESDFYVPGGDAEPPMVWMGCEGCTAQAHFDVSHNFHHVVYGQKRFLLVPPEQASRMYIYPYLHPGYRMSQVPIEDGNRTNFPWFDAVSALEAILNPGETLYIPPMWFHHVQTPRASIGINVWTRPAELLRLHSLFFSAGNPVDERYKDRDITEAIAVVASVISQLLAHVYTPAGVPYFASELVQSRYNFTEARVLSAGCDAPPESSFRVEKDARDFLKKSEAKEVFSTLPQEWRIIWLGSYAEHLIAEAVGASVVAPVLRTCFPHQFP